MANAKKLIQENLQSKNPILDLGNCGLDGTEAELELLAECSHLQTLIFSTEWREYEEEKQKYVRKESRNKGQNNKLTQLPTHLPQEINKLVLAGGIVDNWGIQDIDALQHLTGLQTLVLFSNQIQDISPLKELENLQSLSLSANQIQDISPLKELVKLQTLDLSYNQIQDISPLKELVNLKELDLRNNQIQDISPLKELVNLQYLYLWNNQIQDISPLKELVNLQYLYLWNNQIQDISPLKELVNLQSLGLSANQIQDISPLKNLVNLQKLDLRSNQIQDISPLKELENLQKLDLRSNKIQDISPLKELGNLKELYLSANQIQDISPLKELGNLKELYLSENQIQDISLAFLNHFPELEKLYLYENPIQNIPKEIFSKGNCLEEVKNYLEDLATGKVKVYQAKIIIIGNGRVGKTCLVKRWLDNSFDEDEKSTHAIQLRKVFLEKLAQKEGFDEIQLHIWDFGGQDIYHATHQFFMQSKALFLLAWDIENEPENKLTQTETLAGQTISYQNLSWRAWLSYVQTASEGSPVLVVQTKKDKAGHGEQAPPLKSRIDPKAFSIRKFLAIDSAEKDEDYNGFDDLKKQIRLLIKEEIQKNTHELPTTWWKVQEALAGLEEQRITREQFEEFCRENEVPPKSMPTLLRYLHDTGFFFYREGLFDNQIILDQKWAIEAVYELFRRDTGRRNLFLRLQNNGFFEGQDLIDVWQKYNAEEQELFLSFMESTKICVEVSEHYQDKEQKERVPFGQRVYLAPQLLPDEQIPNQREAFPEKQGLFFKFSHQFLHTAIIQQFIINSVHLAQRDNIKQKRILIRYKGQKALIEALPANNEMIVRILKEEDKGILNYVRETLEDIQANISGISEKVSIDGEGYVLLSDLQGENTEVRAENGTYYPKKDFEVFLEKAQEEKLEITWIQEALNHLEQANLADYFEAMDKVEIPKNWSLVYQKLKQKYIGGYVNEDFFPQLRTFTNEIKRLSGGE